MNTRQRIALAWPPLLLRLGLAMTFMWAGAAKVLEDTTLTSAEATTLAAMGVSLGKGSTAAPVSTPSAPVTKPETHAPTPAGPDAPLPAPDHPAPGKAEPPKGDPAKAGGKVKDAGKSANKPSSAPRINNRTASASAEGAFDLPTPPVAAKTQDQPAPGAATKEHASLPEGLKVRGLYRIALMVHDAAKPGGAKALWPASLATGNLPVYLAWSVAITELVGGFFVLVGLLTRLSALGIAGVMCGAIWLTQIGPAMQSGKAVMGFLPSYSVFDLAAWMPLQWLVALLCMSLALFFAGPGVAAMDNVLLGPSEKKKPGPPPPAPKPG